MALLALPFSAASAATFPSFTLNPAAVPLTGGAQFTADNIVVSDFSTITFTSGTPATARNFTDVGFLPIATFQNQTATVNPGGLNQPGGYGLYFQFSGTGTQNVPNSDKSSTGTLANIAFSLYGFNQTGTVSFNPNGQTTSGITNPTLLSTGSLINGNVFTNTIIGGGLIPGASAVVAFTPVAAEQNFFVAPKPFYLDITTAFTNTSSAISFAADGNSFTINGGGGQANFFTPIPEPASLLVLSAGLGAVGLLRRRARA